MPPAAVPGRGRMIEKPALCPVALEVFNVHFGERKVFAQQWAACKLYGELLAKQKAGDPASSDEEIRNILMRVYKEHPPKDPRFLKWKSIKTDTAYSANNP